MKISKLFHWLYAVVMLLPIFAIGVTCGYAMLNKNAYQSYYGENINERVLTGIQNVNELNNDTTYNFFAEQGDNYSYLGSGNSSIYISNFVDYGNLNISFEPTYFLYYKDNSNGRLYLQFRNENQFLAKDTGSQSFNFDFDFVSSSGALPLSNLVSFVSVVSYNKMSFISEVFYYSVDRVTQSNLFSWAYDSFLVAPFSYIVALFSMPTNSPVVLLLSYWLSISIIWLVFDLIMYVPLLAHRWLDKGMVE